MTITESRLKDGKLTLGPTGTGGVDMSCQITNTVIVSNYTDDGDAVTTLCGDQKPAGRKLDSRTLDGTFIQDWDTEAGITAYIWDNDLTVVAYTYTPNTGGLVITGTVLLEVPQNTYGGDTATRLTSDFSWKMQDEPTFTYGAPLGTTLTEDQATELVNA